MEAEWDYADGEELDWGDYDYGGYQQDYDTEQMQFDDKGLTVQETINHCVVPTTNDAIAHIGKLLFWCFVLRIIVTACEYLMVHLSCQNNYTC